MDLLFTTQEKTKTTMSKKNNRFMVTIDPRLEKIEVYLHEEQKKIITSSDRYMMVEGVAGSRKTDTLVRLGLRRHFRENKSLLFLTQVGSVTDEIRMRLEQYLGVPIHRQHGSNHYLVISNDKTIEIANFDAWIHKQLDALEWKHLKTMGSYHTYKAEALAKMVEDEKYGERMRRLGFCMKNGQRAEEVLIDECQDFEASRARLVVGLLTRCSETTRAVFCGDYMQTIFDRSLQENTHPMRVFETLPEIMRFQLDLCYRCPRAHIEFGNRLMKDSLVQHERPPIRSANQNTTDRPFLFTHGSLNKQYDVYMLAGQLCDMLGILVRHDPTITPGDVCFLMRRSNDQAVFTALLPQLERFWNARKHYNVAIHFATQFDGFRNSIHWGMAEGKTVLLSIHGDKGKGHKVVFFLGLTQKSIPDECSVYKSTELLYQSLVNVALTRSTRYLFISFHHTQPSLYLSRMIEDLKDLVYRAWETDNIPVGLYREIADRCNVSALSKNPPNFGLRYRETPLMVPTLNLKTVTEVSRQFERFEDLFGYRLKTETIIFGERTSFRLAHDQYPILGHMAELLLNRQVAFQTFCRELKNWQDPRQIFYTEDERLLCWVADFGLHRHIGVEELYRGQVHQMEEMHQHLFRADPHLASALTRMKSDMVYVLPQCFQSLNFQQELSRFSDTTPNEGLPFRSWWRLALLFHEVKGKQRRPWIERHMEFDLPVSQQGCFVKMIRNVKALSVFFSKENVLFHPSHEARAQIQTPEMLESLGFVNHPDLDEKIFRHGYHYGVTGISDVLDIDKETLYEIKASHVESSVEWWIQNTLYGCLPMRHSEMMSKKYPFPKTLVLVNVVTGKLQKWLLPTVHPKVILTKLLTTHSFPSELIAHLCKICHSRLKHFPRPPEKSTTTEEER